MDVTLINEFINELAEIEDYLEYSDHTGSYLKTILDLPESPSFNNEEFRLTKRLFEYKAIVISLYGLLEKYVENWIKEYLNILTNLVSYDKIDEVIKNNHFDNSLSLIQGIHRNKFQYLNLNKKDLLKNLYECETNVQFYTFNSDAFILASSGNLKHEKIAAIFGSIGIELDQKLRKIDKFANYLRESYERIETLKSEKLYEKIDSLVDRRNDISHGGEVSDILNKQFLKDYIEFLKNYCEAIFDILKTDLIIKEKNYQFAQIIVKKAYSRLEVLKIEAQDCSIEVGDFIILEVGQEESVVKMKVSNKCVQNISSQIIITIKVELPDNSSIKLKDNHKYYVKKKVVS